MNCLKFLILMVLTGSGLLACSKKDLGSNEGSSRPSRAIASADDSIFKAVEEFLANLSLTVDEAESSSWKNQLSTKSAIGKVTNLITQSDVWIIDLEPGTVTFVSNAETSPEAAAVLETGFREFISNRNGTLKLVVPHTERERVSPAPIAGEEAALVGQPIVFLVGSVFVASSTNPSAASSRALRFAANTGTSSTTTIITAGTPKTDAEIASYCASFTAYVDCLPNSEGKYFFEITMNCPRECQVNQYAPPFFAGEGVGLWCLPPKAGGPVTGVEREMAVSCIPRCRPGMKDKGDGTCVCKNPEMKWNSILGKCALDCRGERPHINPSLNANIEGAEPGGCDCRGVSFGRKDFTDGYGRRLTNMPTCKTCAEVYGKAHLIQEPESRRYKCQCDPGTVYNRATEKCEDVICPAGKIWSNFSNKCVCNTPGFGLDSKDKCVPCDHYFGMKPNEKGDCACADPKTKYVTFLPAHPAPPIYGSCVLPPAKLDCTRDGIAARGTGDGACIIQACPPKGDAEACRIMTETDERICQAAVDQCVQANNVMQTN